MNRREEGGGPLALPALLLVVLIAALAALPELLRLPEPEGALLLDRASFSLDGGPEQAVGLPHSWPRLPPGPAEVRYVIEFALAEPPPRAQHLYFPAARQEIAATLNGAPLDFPAEALWSTAAQGRTVLARVSADLLRAGSNRLVVTLSRVEGAVPGHLSGAWLGDEGTVVRHPWLAGFLSGQGRTTAFVLHLVIFIGLATVWSARRHDAVFRWLILLGGTTLAFVAADLQALPQFAEPLRPFLALALSAFGMMALGLAMAVVDMKRPPWLRYAVAGVPAVLLLAALAFPAGRLATVMASAAVALLGHLAAATVLVRGFVRERRWDFGLLAVPFLLVVWIGLRDVLVVLGAKEAGFLLSNYVRPLTLLAVLVLLMRRLATSLNSLDAANDVLRQKLAEQEAELSALHERERLLAAQAVREQERHRLMQDLHDGLSGHLVSIIALSERDAGNQGAIERAAREALDDLRLVINSLDLGDGDLPLALASFRERLAPRLRRLGIEFGWSMEKLPEVSGVTPGNALSVLRILQEAVTNAIKHGPARRIEVEGAAGGDGSAIVTVSNDGGGEVAPGRGHGLGNMQRRARQFGGSVSLDLAADHAVLTLVLPAHLAES